MLDTDDSGLITIDELKAAFEGSEVKDEEMWTEIMREVDKNGDGNISLDEFIEAMTGFTKRRISTIRVGSTVRSS